MQRINGFWYCLPYGAYQSSELRELENCALHMSASVATQFLWQSTNFKWHTCEVWVQWLGDIHPDLPIASTKLTQQSE